MILLLSACAARKKVRRKRVTALAFCPHFGPALGRRKAFFWGAWVGEPMDFRISEPAEVSCDQGSPPLAGCVLCTPILTV